MEWDTSLKNFKIVTFTRDQILLDTIAEYFSNMRGVTIVDLLFMDDSLAEKFIDVYNIDIVFIEEEFVNSVPVNKLIEKASAESQKANTHFILRYDDKCAEKMMDFGEHLLDKKLPITQSRLDEEDDYIILAQTIRGVLMRKEQLEKIRLLDLEQELLRLLHNEE